MSDADKQLAEAVARLKPFSNKCLAAGSDMIYGKENAQSGRDILTLLAALAQDRSEIERLKAALAKRDKLAGECPDAKLDPNKDCPRCGATSNEGCRVTVLADAALAHAVRQITNPETK